MDEIRMMHKRPRGGRGGRPTDIVFTMEGFLLALQYYDDSRAARFRMMQACLTAQVTREIADQRHREDQARIAELTQAQHALTSTVANQRQDIANQREDIAVLECGVWNYIRDELKLDDVYKPQWNDDAKKIDVIVNELRRRGLIEKRGPKRTNYFKDVASMEVGLAIIEEHRIREMEKRSLVKQRSVFRNFFKK
jgi:hypothetical protein